MEEENIFKSADILESQLDKIRDLYLLLKELKSRHEVTMDPRMKSRSQKLVYCSKQETPLMKDPDSQKLYREQLINKISEIPTLKPIPFYADSLFSEYLTSELKSSPSEIRKVLSEHFFNKIISLQHQKFKTLLNWSHQTEISLEVHTKDLDSQVKLIQNEIEDSVSRFERLRYNEEYDSTRVRPSPKTEDGTNLFHEEPVVNFSSIAKDDLEIYIKDQVRSLKAMRHLTRFLSRLNWLWVSQRVQIWKASMVYLDSVHKRSISRMFTIKGKKLDLPVENRESIDMPPTIITSTQQLQILLNSIGEEFGLKTDLELDDGHSLAYQVTHLLPELFELQRQRLDWNPTGSPEEREKAEIRFANLQSLKVHRLSAIRKANSVSQPGGSEELTSLKPFKMLNARAAEWLGFVKLRPQQAAWERRQRARLDSCKRDQLLENAFNVLNLQDLPTVNKLLEEFAVGYADRANRILKVKPIDQSDVNVCSSYFSNIIIERNLDPKIVNEGVNLPPQCIKSLYTLNMIKSRNKKQELFDVLNVYRAIQKRLAYDMTDLGTREEIRPDQEKKEFLQVKKGFNPALNYLSNEANDFFPKGFPGLYGRRDVIEKLFGDYYVKSNKGDYVVYSIIDKDYSEVIEELIKIGSFFIEKYEQSDSNSFIDRDFFASELLQAEVQFQSTKLRLILLFMQMYENSVDNQSDLGQKITNLMAMRPRLHLKSTYFMQSYWAHIDSLSSQISLIETLMDLKSPSQTFDPYIANLMQVFTNLDKNLTEMSLIMEVESPLHLSAFELATWTQAMYEWKVSQCYSLVLFDDGVLIDKPDFILSLCKELSLDVHSGNIVNFPIVPPAFYEGKKVKILSACPSELTISCNYFEMWRLRALLEACLIDCMVLEEIYKKQSSIMKKDIHTVEHADLGMGLRHFPEVDDGPGTKEDFWLPAFEFDSKLKAHFHLSSIPAVKYLLLPWGIQELKAIYAYQVMHKHLLAVAVQQNAFVLDKWLKNVAEIEIFRDLSMVSSSFTFPVKSLVIEQKLNVEKTEAEIKKIYSKIVVDGSKNYFDTKARKMRNRQRMEGAYKRIAEKLKSFFLETDHIGILIRNLRVLIVDGYCREVLRDAYHDAIRVQICKVSHEYRRLLKLVPIDVLSDTFDGNDEKAKSIIDGETVNIEFVLTVDEIMKLKGFKEDDREHWRGWEGFIKAETSDILAAYRPAKSKEPIVSNLLFRNDWDFKSQLRTVLEVFVSVVQVLQVWMFLNLLGEKVSEVMNMQDSTWAGENYWGVDITNIGEKSKKKILDEMLDTQNPKYLLEEAIKRSLSNLKVMALQYSDITRADDVSMSIFQSRRAFYILSLALFQSYHHSLMHEKNKDSDKVIEFISYLFRYSRTKISVPAVPVACLFSNPSCEVIERCSRKIFICNDVNEFLPGCYVYEFEWGMLEASSEERNHTLATTTAMQLKLENLLSLRSSAKGYNALEIASATCAYMAPELEAWRLKSGIFVAKCGDLIKDPVLYEKLLSQFKDVLEWRSNKSFAVDSDDHIRNPVVSEVILLREIFNSKICVSTIEFMKLVADQLGKASTVDAPCVSTDNFTCNIVKPYTDIHRKVGVLHNFLNVLRNRGSIVDAPVSGKALVFSVKDLTQLTKRFTEQILRYVDSEFRVQGENHDIEISKVAAEVMKRNKEIHAFKRNINALQESIVNLVNSQLAQKGTQLIYELDISARQLSEIKDNSKNLENQLVTLIRNEMTSKIQRQRNKILNLEMKFGEFREQVATEIKADIDSKKSEALNELKGSAGKYKNINTSEAKESKKNPKSKRTLVRIQEMIKKMLQQNQWARLKTTQNYDKHLQDLKSQLSSNQYLWEQLNESQRRENLLKQELSYTQQALSAAEKLAEKLQTQIEDMNSQRLRLQQYKANKGKRLSELEDQVKQFEKIEYLDNQKLLSSYIKQKRRIQIQKNGELDGHQQYLSQHNGFQREINELKNKIKKERKLKMEAYDQLSLFKEEMQGIEQDQDPSLKLWQSRYYEILDDLRTNKEENIKLRERISDQGDYDFIDKFPDLIRPKSNLSLPSVHLPTPRSSSFRSNR